MGSTNGAAIGRYSRNTRRHCGVARSWGSHISVVTMGENLTTVDGHIEAFRRGVT
jgi:hypothetical protein